MTVRYVSLAYGTRDEIMQLLRNSLAGARSSRRQHEVVSAIAELEQGDTSITFGNTTYLVEDHPLEG